MIVQGFITPSFTSFFAKYRYIGYPHFNHCKAHNVLKRIRDKETTAIIYEVSMRLCNTSKLLIKYTK
mgnify:CR=1 FL=1